MLIRPGHQHQTTAVDHTIRGSLIARSYVADLVFAEDDISAADIAMVLRGRIAARYRSMRNPCSESIRSFGPRFGRRLCPSFLQAPQQNFGKHAVKVKATIAALTTAMMGSRLSRGIPSQTSRGRVSTARPPTNSTITSSSQRASDAEQTAPDRTPGQYVRNDNDPADRLRRRRAEIARGLLEARIEIAERCRNRDDHVRQAGHRVEQGLRRSFEFKSPRSIR